MKTFILLTLFLLAPLTSSDPITLTGVGDPWPVLLNPDSEKQGLVIELAREALSIEGLSLEVDFVPWTRAMAMIKQKRVDILAGAWYTDERNEYLLYSDPILSSAIRFIGHKKVNFQFTNVKSLNGLRIGTIDSYQYDQDFLTANGFERIYSDSLLVNIQNLMAGRIDLVVDDQFVLRHTLDKHINNWQDSIQFIEKPLAKKEIYIAANRFNPNSDFIIKAFNSGLSKLKKNGRYQQILDSYSLEY